MAEKKGGEKKGGDGIVSAIYKVNLHCPECAREVKKPLRKAKGVQKVEVDLEESKVTVIGAIDGKKIHELIEKKTKKKVEIVSVEAKKDDPSTKKGTEEVKVITTVIKVQMHCEKCEYDLKRKLLKVKGVRNVKIDSNMQTCTVESTVESQKLIEYIHKKFSHKYAEIVPEKKKEKEKEKEKKVEEKKETIIKEVEVEVEVEVEKSGKEKSKEGKDKPKSDEPVVPYFVHCTHAPMLFSDENPNACHIM